MNFLRGKKILLVSPEPWDYIFVSKHHYATYLAKSGNIVYFLNPPGNHYKLYKTRYSNLWSLHYKGFPKGLRLYPKPLQNYFIRKIFLRLQKICQVDFDIIWSFDNSLFYDFSALPKSLLKISHIVDLNQDFQTSRAAKTADVCFCTTDLIVQRLKKYTENVFKINHGFNEIKYEENESSLPGSNPIKAVLVGNLAMQYFDWKIILDCVVHNPKVDFIFYGPNANDYSIKTNPHHSFKKDLTKYPNTYFPGKIAADEIPSILLKADVLLVSYQESYHREQANPHKIMEYLGSGRMIIATKTLEYQHLASKSLIAMSCKNSEFPSVFQSTLGDLDKWYQKDKIMGRINFAKENSYDKQIGRISTIITSLRH